MKKRIMTPLIDDQIMQLNAGDSVLLTGYIYTARDAAHKRMIHFIMEGKKLPFDIKQQVVYYVGPTPAKEGQVIGSAGPTTSYRMDPYTPQLLERGLKGMIGKGWRSEEVIEAMKKYGSIYFAAIGGAAAFISKCIQSSEIVAYEDLGTEAIRKLYVVDLPLIVAIDTKGNDYYKISQRGNWNR